MPPGSAQLGRVGPPDRWTVSRRPQRTVNEIRKTKKHLPRRSARSDTSPLPDAWPRQARHDSLGAHRRYGPTTNRSNRHSPVEPDNSPRGAAIPMGSTRRRIEWTEELLDEIEGRIIDGEAVTTVASDLGVASSHTVLRAFARAGRESPAKVARRHHQTFLEDAAWLTQRYVTDAMTIRQIAAELHLGDKPVTAALERHGIQPWMPDDEIIAAFENGTSIRAISRELGVDRDVVRRVLRINGLHDGGRRIGPAALVDPRRLRRWYLIEQMSTGEIAERLGVSRSAVKKALQRHEIPAMGHRGAHPRLRDRDWLQRRHLDEHRTFAQIATELEVSDTTVWRAFKRLGIKRPFRAVLTDRDWLWNTHRRDDIGVQRIARWPRVDPSIVVEALIDNDIEPRDRPDDYAAGPEHLLDPDWLMERHVIDHASIEQIAEQTNTRTVAVRQALRDSGIPRQTSRA